MEHKKQLQQYRDDLVSHQCQLEEIAVAYGEDTIIYDTINRIGKIIVKIDIEIALCDAEIALENAMKYLEQ